MNMSVFGAKYTILAVLYGLVSCQMGMKKSALRRSADFFIGALKSYRYTYCGRPTGGRGGNRKKRAGNARPYVIDLRSVYARRGDHWSPVVQVLPAATPQSAMPTAPLTYGSLGSGGFILDRYGNCSCPTGGCGGNRKKTGGQCPPLRYGF